MNLNRIFESTLKEGNANKGKTVKCANWAELFNLVQQIMDTDDWGWTILDWEDDFHYILTQLYPHV